MAEALLDPWSDILLNRRFEKLPDYLNKNLSKGFFMWIDGLTWNEPSEKSNEILNEYLADTPFHCLVESHGNIIVCHKGDEVLLAKGTFNG